MVENLVVYGTYTGIETAAAARAALTDAGFPDTAATLSAIAPLQADGPGRECAAESAVADGVGAYASTTARMAGSMLALGSAAMLAPVLLAGPVLAAVFGKPLAAPPRADHGPEPAVLLTVQCIGRESAARAKDILESTGALNIAIAELQGPADDLKIREYRDQLGELHHHTRTYMRDHVAQ